MAEGKIKLYMGIPSLGTRSDVQTYALRSLEKKYSDKIEFIYPSVFCARIFHDYARCEIVKDFLNSEADILWFLDSDVAPPTNILDLITEHGEKWSLAGAPYPLFITPPGYDAPQVAFSVYTKMDSGGMTYAHQIPQSGTGFVDGVATGCIFIKRDVFKDLEKPYFEFKYENETRRMTEGEDLGFCRKVSEKGHKFFIDYSMVCKHYKQVDLLDVNNYAIMYANNAVMAFHRALNNEVAKRRLGLSKPNSGIIIPKF